MTETDSPVIELRNVVKSYGNNQVLRGFSLSLLPGQIVGLVGPNGVGKTTAMRILMGQTLPDSGEVLWHGEPMTRTTVKKVGYLPEERDLHQKMSVRTQLEFASRLNGASWEHASDYVEQVLHRLGLTERADSTLDTLSLGAQQRVQLAAALVHNPQALILDEPDSGLDGESAELMRIVLTEIASRGVPVLITSHRIQFVEDTCTHLAVMIEGAIRALGPIDEIMSSGPRHFRITADRIAPGWTRVVRGATELESIEGYSKVELAPGVDEQLLLTTALEHGPLTEFTPIDPALDELYGYIANVTRDGRVLGSGLIDAPLSAIPVAASSPQQYDAPSESTYREAEYVDADDSYGRSSDPYQADPIQAYVPETVAYADSSGGMPNYSNPLSAQSAASTPLDGYLGQHTPTQNPELPDSEIQFVDPTSTPKPSQPAQVDGLLGTGSQGSQFSAPEYEGSRSTGELGRVDLGSSELSGEASSLYASSPVPGPMDPSPAFTIPSAPEPIRTPISGIAPVEVSPIPSTPAPPTRVSTIPSREIDPATVAQRFATQQTQHAPPSQLPPPTSPALEHATQGASSAGADRRESRVPGSSWDREADGHEAPAGNTWWSRLRGRPDGE